MFNLEKLDSARKCISCDRWHKRKFEGLPQTFDSVTTILNQKAKPALVTWAARMAAEHIESKMEGHLADDKITVEEIFKWCLEARTAYAEERDSKADLGTKLHRLMQLASVKFIDALQPESNVISEYDALLCELGDVGENALSQWRDWQEKTNTKIVRAEVTVYNESQGYAGCADALAMRERPCVVDYKTGGVWLEAFLQTVAYGNALADMGVVGSMHDLDYVLVHIPRTVDEKLVEYTVKHDSQATLNDLKDMAWTAFVSCNELKTADKYIKLVEVAWKKKNMNSPLPRKMQNETQEN